jgi:hypothetical protein
MYVGGWSSFQAIELCLHSATGVVDELSGAEVV